MKRRRLIGGFGPSAGALAPLLALVTLSLLGGETRVGGFTIRREGAPSPVDIEVNTRAVAPETSGDVFSACRIEPPEAHRAPLWEGWVSLEGERLGASSSAETLPVYAARIPDGAALVVANHAQAGQTFRLRLRLPRGVYKVERLLFAPTMPEVPPRLERLQSVILEREGVLEKPGGLMPGMAAIYRCVNSHARTTMLLWEVREALRPWMRDRRREYQRLMTPLQECAAHISKIAKGIRLPERYESLKHLHRALLTVSHAQTLTRNFRGQGRVNKESAGTVEESLDRLEENLTDLSVGCLDLVPGVRVSPPDVLRPGIREVSVSLVNAGARSLDAVRITATAPAGYRLQPSEPAVFGRLRPGQAARVAFTLQGEMSAGAPLIDADIAYYAARAPAHIHLTNTLPLGRR